MATVSTVFGEYTVTILRGLSPFALMYRTMPCMLILGNSIKYSKHLSSNTRVNVQMGKNQMSMLQTFSKLN